MENNYCAIVSGLQKIRESKLCKAIRGGLFFVMICITQAFASDSYAQSTRLSLNIENQPLQKILEVIEEQTEFRFMYDATVVDVHQRKSIQCKDQPVTKILDDIFKDSGISYKIDDRQIALSRSEIRSSYQQTSQQQRTVTGTVTDQRGEPLPGATVVIKGTTQGTVTDAKGNYSLSNVPGDATLVFSFVGMETQEINVGNKTKINVTMQEEAVALQEVVAVGYGTQRRESLTGSLQVVKSDKLKDITTPSTENLLNGKVPGVYVASGSGQPGSTGAILIRGKSTINGSTDPLWVIDGVIVGSSPGALNPADIETLTVLKDAASTAIYGSQGANGVIVVTTKKPLVDKLSVNFSMKGGGTRLNNGNLKVMNGAELYDYYKSFSNAEQISFPRWNEDLRNSNFDWWKFASQTGVIQDYNMSVSGGSAQLKSLLSVGIYDEKGAVKGYDYTRYNFLFKTDYTPFEWLTFKPYLYGSKNDIDDRQHSVAAMYSNLPWDSPYDENGNIIGHYSDKWVNSNSTNYVYDLQWNFAKSTTYEFSGNFDFDLRFTDWLTFSSVNNFRYSGYPYNSYTDPRSSGGMGVKGRIYEYQSNVTRRYTNQLLKLNKVLNGVHSLNALLGYEFNDYHSKNISATGVGFVPGFQILDVTSKPEAVTGSISEWAVQSMFANVNYSYNNRYLGQLSLRRDGASNFGDNAKYGNFFSISGGWNIHQEAFFNVDWINQLKLRASYGSVGNRPSSLYPQYDLYSVSQTYNENPGALISQIGNKDLTWEKTYTTGIGLDASFLDRLRLTFDYYEKNTSNLLYRVPVSGLTGVTSIWRNVGEVRNRGFEAIVGADIIKNKNLLWTFDGNIGLNRNKVTKLYGEKTEIIVGDGVGIAGSANILLKPGLDADSWYLREWAGVDPQTGSPLWYKTVKDEKGNVTRETTNKYEEADQVVTGTFTPKFFGGFSTNLVWKQFDMNAVFGYSVGGKIYNYTRQEYDSDGAYTDRNQMKLMSGWKRWEKPGDIATHPLPAYNNSSNSNKASSRYLEDGTYLKLRSLSFGYNFSLPKYHISNLRIYLNGENLLTFTGYSGVDPEIPPYDNKIVGVTTTVYPSTRKFIAGINLTF